MIPAWLAPYMVWVRLAVLLAVFGAGMWLEATIKNGQIANERADRFEQIAKGAIDTLDQFQHDARLINSAANEFAGLQSDNDVKFARLELELRNAFKNPLPDNCLPDPPRVRSFSAAIAAANDTAAGRLSGPAVPATP